MNSFDILWIAISQWLLMRIGLIDKFQFLTQKQKELGKKYEKQLTLVLLAFGSVKMFFNHPLFEMLFMAVLMTYCIFAVMEVYIYEGVENARN